MQDVDTLFLNQHYSLRLLTHYYRSFAYNIFSVPLLCDSFEGNSTDGPCVCWAGMAPCLEYWPAFTCTLGMGEEVPPLPVVFLVAPLWWMFLRTLHTSWRSASKSVGQGNKQGITHTHTHTHYTTLRKTNHEFILIVY